MLIKVIAKFIFIFVPTWSYILYSSNVVWGSPNVTFLLPLMTFLFHFSYILRFALFVFISHRCGIGHHASSCCAVCWEIKTFIENACGGRSDSDVCLTSYECTLYRTPFRAARYGHLLNCRPTSDGWSQWRNKQDDFLGFILAQLNLNLMSASGFLVRLTLITKWMIVVPKGKTTTFGNHDWVGR